MSQGNDFANYAASADGRATASEDVWFVAVASDDIKQMNVDQLDEAFRLGIITAETAVWTEGMDAWAPLGEVADLGGDEDEGAEQDAPSPEHIGSHVSAGHASAGHASAGYASAGYASAGYASAGHASAGHASAGYGAPFSGAAHQHGGSLASGPSSVAPVTASFAPSASNAPFVQSTVPVALNVDEDMPPIRVGRRFRLERWLLAAAAIVGVGVTAYNNSDLLASSSSAPVAAAAALPAESPAPTSRGYDVGEGVEKGASLPATAADGEGSSDSSKKEASADAPIGAASAVSAKETEKAKDEAAPEAPSSKQSLKSSFAKGFNKKAPVAKARAAKPRKAAIRAAAAPKAKKKAGTGKAGSAFDPLNDSLP